jgi:CelD/BcsL family acetyltransferase involved in cellulose biosynthesis
MTSLDELRGEWSALGARGDSVFRTWEWASTWYRHLGRGRPLLLHTERGEDGRLRTVLPLYAWQERPLRVLRFLGHDQGDELGPVHAPGDDTFAAAALRRTLEQLPFDVVLAEQLPGDAGWAGRLGARRWRLESAPTLRWRDGWDEFLRSRSANFREQVLRRERRLRERYDVALRLVEDADRLDSALDVLFDLHRRRWGPDSAFAPEQFHREFARVALDRGWLRLWLLELDGVPAAAWCGFRLGGVESYYQAGRDPRFEADAVGFVLLTHTIRAALDDGMEEYRFLRGGEHYKSRFANADPGLESVVLAGSGRGAAAVAAGRAAKQARNAVRRLRARR